MPKISITIDPQSLELNRVTLIPTPEIRVFFEELSQENIFSGGVMLRDKLAARK